MILLNRADAETLCPQSRNPQRSRLRAGQRRHDGNSVSDSSGADAHFIVVLGKVSIRTTSGVSHLGGLLCKLPNVTPELTGDKVAELMEEIRRVPSVLRVQATFTNWQECGNAWKPIATKSSSLLPSGKELPGSSGVLDLTELERELESQEKNK